MWPRRTRDLEASHVSSTHHLRPRRITCVLETSLASSTHRLRPRRITCVLDASLALSKHHLRPRPLSPRPRPLSLRPPPAVISILPPLSSRPEGEISRDGHQSQGGSSPEGRDFSLALEMTGITLEMTGRGVSSRPEGEISNRTWGRAPTTRWHTINGMKTEFLDSFMAVRILELNAGQPRHLKRSMK